MKWQSIETAPKDGTIIKVCIIENGEKSFEREACWRCIYFDSFINGKHGIEPGYEYTGWAYTHEDKRIPSPTHWMHLK
ncbi:MAG: hypothetical protein ACXWT4_06060 [Methylobacter sp.]